MRMPSGDGRTTAGPTFDHERQIEEQFELRGGPMRLVGGTRRHPDPERRPAARRSGFRQSPRLHA
jgi:hypothetical protein